MVHCAGRLGGTLQVPRRRPGAVSTAPSTTLPRRRGVRPPPLAPRLRPCAAGAAVTPAGSLLLTPPLAAAGPPPRPLRRSLCKARSPPPPPRTLGIYRRGRVGESARLRRIGAWRRRRPGAGPAPRAGGRRRLGSAGGAASGDHRPGAESAARAVLARRRQARSRRQPARYANPAAILACGRRGDGGGWQPAATVGPVALGEAESVCGRGGL